MRRRLRLFRRSGRRHEGRGRALSRPAQRDRRRGGDRRMSLKDQVVLVTGASRGIGRAIATLAAQDGARLVLCSRSADPLRDAARELSNTVDVLAVPCDVSRESEVERLRDESIARFGRVDCIVNNAGSAESMPFLKTERAFWDRL